jgi:ABC-type uncharacterized transport system substrate-binding protein
MVSLIRHLLVVLAGLVVVGPVWAHPHVWVTMKSELIYAADGNITGIQQHWTFDDMFSTFATQAIPSKIKGQFTRDDLAPLAQTNVESLKEYAYFTYATADGKKVPFADPLPGYWLDYQYKNLVLNFFLPFKQPVKAKLLKIEIYDPTIFVDFEFSKNAPVELRGAPDGCKLDVVLPKTNTATQSQKLDEGFFSSLTKSQDWGAQFANKILVNCP